MTCTYSDSTQNSSVSVTGVHMRTDMERTGGKLDKAMKAAQAAEDQTT